MSLPKTPIKGDPETRRFLEAVRQRLESVDRTALTLADLKSTGFFARNGIDVTGGDNTTVDAPTTPTALTADGAFENIILTWDYPEYSGHSNSRIYRSTTNVFANAEVLANVDSRVYADAVGSNVTYYYWVSNVNANGIESATSQTAGVAGTTLPNTNYLLTELTNAIGNSQLNTQLGTRINTIESTQSALQSSTAQIEADVAVLESETSNLQAQINDLLAVGPYDNATTYVVDDQVTYDGKLYRALQTTTGNLPTNTTYWQLLGNYNSLGELAGDNAAAIAAINTVSAGSSSANAQAVFALQTTVNNPTTGVSALNTAYSGLNTRLTSAEGSISAQASDITALETTVNHPSTGVAATSSAVSLLTTRVTTAEGNISANTTDITALENSVFHPTTGLAATASGLSTLSSQVNNGTTGLSATVGRVTSLEATVNNGTTGVLATATALDSLESAVYNGTTGLAATASRVSVLEASVNNGTTGLSATATLAAELKAEVFPNGTAAASAIDTLSTTVGNNTTAIQTQATSINGLQGQYTVKIDNNGYVSGFGLASTAVNGSPISSFIIRADSFAISSPTGPSVPQRIPFVVVTTPTVENGVTIPAGVYIDNATIKDGSILNAKIGTAAIDTAKIADGAISNAKIGFAAVGTANIQDGSIVNAKIANAAIGQANIIDASIVSAKIADAAVGTLKIAGNAVTLPQVYTAADLNVVNTITVSTGSSCDYVYVGSGGDYTFDIESGFFVSVPEGTGDYDYVCTSGGSVTGGHVLIETPFITVGDAGANGGLIIVFYATMDATALKDAGQNVVMLIDTGSGYQVSRTTKVGATTNNGNTFASLPVAIATSINGVQQARIKIMTGKFLISNASTSNSSYMRNSTLSVLGAKR